MRDEDYHLDHLVAFAQSRGGRCVSVEYFGVATAHEWECGAGHEFEGSPRLLIMGGYWCPTCFPTVSDTTGWDYDALSAIDPLLRRFHFLD